MTEAPVLRFRAALALATVCLPARTALPQQPFPSDSSVRTTLAQLVADTGISAALHDALRPRRAFGTRGDSIGLNWIVSRRGERAIAWHNGGTAGYRTFLGLDLDARRTDWTTSASTCWIPPCRSRRTAVGVETRTEAISLSG